MMIFHSIALLCVCLPIASAETPSLRGTITDPSGAAIPGATVQIRGPGGEHRTKTDRSGQYAFSTLAPGHYEVRVSAKHFSIALKEVNITAKDFSISLNKDLLIDRPSVFDVQLVIKGEKQVIDVDDQVHRVGPEPEANGDSLILRERQLAALSDDPDELALQLQALAGPAPGPNGGGVFIDGFNGGNLPPKSSIREVRINSNPFSPEYDRPGFARIEIFTKPGSADFHGQAFTQFNDTILNSRNPLLTQPGRIPYRTQFYGFNLSGPLRKNKASFTFDAEHRQIDDNAFILATTLDANLKPQAISQALPTPQSRTTLSPRIEYALSPRNTLVARYQEVRVGLDNQGVGDFSLASRAYRETQSERTLQLTETAAISPRLINETRFQYLRSTDQASSASAAAVLNVVGAFIGGGSTIGSSGTLINNSELTNITTYTRGGHTFKWGARVRQAFLSDTSFRDFAGTYTFYTLDQYQKTIALQQAGYSGAQLTALGGGPTQFTLNLGTPLTRVRQTDVGAFVNDDLRLRPNLMINFGLRYEAQSNLGRLTDFAPRIGIAWGIGGGAGRPSKTVLRAGAGTFFDRIPLTTTLNSLRFDGATQQSYSIFNPTFYPAIPSAADLLANRQPQQLQPVFAGIQAPRLYQTSLSLERQVTSTARVTLNWISTRGVHLLNLRNINAPVDGVYPFPDRSTRFLTESAGFSRLNQIVTNVNIDQKKYFVFGYYALSYAKDNNEGQPANPYDLRAEWGPSSYGDIRHRMVFGTSVPLLWKFSATSFVAANSGVPYNITTGLDPASTGYPADRPALLQGIAASACQGGGLLYASELGCFALTPPPGTPRIGHNSARGSANANMTLRIARTWSFGGEGSSNAPPSSTHSPGPMNPGGHGGNDSAGTTTGRRYSLTLGASTLNALNHPNFAPPNGDLSSPYFGQARSLGGLIVMQHGGGASTYNRKIDLQLRFTF